MNFFQAQDTARRKTWQLAALFAAAVGSLIVLTNLLVAGVYLWSGNYAMPESRPLVDLFANMSAEYWLLISTGVVGVVAVASLFKYLTVRGGGRTIAEALGGQLILQSTNDSKQRRLLNIVEEMAIASGVPVPPVYLIGEPSINAFAAGFSVDDAVIGINQGTLDHLTRDELQGVVGHEFSHILNGDSRMNLRLIAMLHGILFIGIIGYGILRGMGGRSRRSSSDGGLPILALGIGLMVIGYSGTFFGNLIKAAVSRQREYLADAAAVQFTRNPGGIADSLKKMGGLSVGSTMSGAAAQEISHMFFGQSAQLFMNGLMATHPPLDERILAIEPGWDGRFKSIAVSEPEPGTDHTAQPSASDRIDVTSGLMDRVSQLAGTAFTQAPSQAYGDSISVTVAAPEISEQVGLLNQASLDSAVGMIGALDPLLRDAAHDAWASRGLIYAMLLDAGDGLREQQLAYLQTHAEAGVPEHVHRLQQAAQALDESHKLTLVEMAMPALKELSGPQFRRFMDNTVAMIKSDRHIELFEWVLHRLFMKELQPHFDGPQRLSARYRSVAQVSGAAVALLSALARSGHDEAGDQQMAFRTGMEELELSGELDSAEDPNFTRLNEALKSLRRLKPLAKPRIIKACAAVALADGHVSGREGALLQGIAAALDCPLPPSIYHHGDSRTESAPTGGGGSRTESAPTGGGGSRMGFEDQIRGRSPLLRS